MAVSARAAATLVSALLICLGSLCLSHHVPVTLPEDEAQHIALDTSGALLPDPKLVSKIIKEVEIIRSTFHDLANITNAGRWKLGQVQVSNATDKNLEDIKASEWAPVKETVTLDDDKTKTTIVFDKPYNPDLLAKELKKKFGVAATGVWKKRGKDFGSIAFKPEENAYTFRQGLDNCAPDCKDNHFWIYKFHEENQTATFYREYATDIPLTVVRNP